MDGGVVNNIPATLIGEVNKLIISDITGPFKEINENSSRTDVLYSAIAMMQQKSCLEKIKLLKVKKIIYLNLKDDEISIVDFRKQNFQRLIDMGYNTVMANKAEIESE